MIYYAVGSQVAFDEYGKASGVHLDGVDSFGYLKSGPLVLSIGTEIEIKYRSLDISAISYLLGGYKTGQAEMYIDGLELKGGNYTYEVDTVSTAFLPNDSNTHTIKATSLVTTNVFRVGCDYANSDHTKLVIESVKIDNVEADIVWTNEEYVGGQSDLVTKFNGNHFLRFRDAKDAILVENLDDYSLESIGEIVNTGETSIPAVNNSFSIIFDGKGYPYISDTNAIDFYGRVSTPATIIIRNFNHVADTAKGSASSGFFRSSGGINFEVYNNRIDLNNLRGTGIILEDTNGVYSGEIYHNVIFQSGNDTTTEGVGGIWINGDTPGTHGTILIEGNTIYNVPQALNVENAEEITQCRNNFFHIHSHATNTAITGTIVDLGGNSISQDSDRSIDLDTSFEHEWVETLYNDYTSEYWGFSSATGNDATHKWEMTDDGIRFQSDTTAVVAALLQQNVLKQNGNKPQVRMTVEVVNHVGGFVKVDAGDFTPVFYIGNTGNGVYVKTINSIATYNPTLYRSALDCDFVVKSIKYEYFNNTFVPIEDGPLHDTGVNQGRTTYFNGFLFANTVFSGAYGRYLPLAIQKKKRHKQMTRKVITQFYMY